MLLIDTLLMVWQDRLHVAASGILTSCCAAQVHFYNKHDLLPPDSDVQSHRVLDSGTDTESNEDGYCTAWGPDTPADIARMTPGFWQGADRRGPPLHTSQTFTAPTPPPFHAGAYGLIASL